MSEKLPTNRKAVTEEWSVARIEEATNAFLTSQVTLLQEEEWISQEGIHAWGAPFVPLTPGRRELEVDNPWRYIGFARSESELQRVWSCIPPKLDMLITHSPPFKIGGLDSSVQHHGKVRAAPLSIGCRALADRLARMPKNDRPKVHLFGHEHDQGGCVHWDDDLGMWFANCSVVAK